MADSKQQKMNNTRKNNKTGNDVNNQHHEDQSSVESRYTSPAYIQLVKDIIENISHPMGFIYHSNQLKIFNQALLNKLGYSAEEIKGIDFRNIITPPEWRNLSEKHIAELKRTGQPQQYQKEYIKKDGSRLPVQIYMQQIIDINGNPDVFVCVFDISARKNAEKKYSNLIEKSNDGIVVLQENVVKFVNSAALKIFGRTTEEILETRFLQYIAPEYHQLLLGRYKKRFEEPAFQEKLEVATIDTDGKKTYVELNSSLFEYEGKPAILSIIRDIDERKKNEAELKLRAMLLDNSTDAITVVDLDGNIIYINDAVIKGSGYSREDLLSKTVFDYIPSQLKEMISEKIQELLEKGHLQSEINLKRKDGVSIPVEFSVDTFESDGKQLAMIIARGILERKKAEAEKKALEQRAQVTSRMAAVGEMAAGIAHEINNPLTAVVGYSELLLSSEIPEAIRPDIESIYEGGRRVAEIVEGLLTFSRQRKPTRKKIDINEVIKATLNLQAYALKNNNIEVVTHLDTNLPMTIADPGQLQQVFLNLIINAQAAVKDSTENRILEISTEEEEDFIRILFKDSGPGIAKDNLDKIFQPFFTTRDVGKGTGLGLSVSHGIISEHNGRIYARSHRGHGATFVVELPVVTKAEQLGLTEAEVEIKEKPQKARILVVDDESIIRKLIDRVLKEDGHEIEVVDNGNEALGRIKSQRYNLILLDIKMPGIGGIELYNRIKEIAASLTGRIMFITGDVMGEDTQQFLLKTKAPYIMKPFDAIKLKTEVTRMLNSI